MNQSYFCAKLSSLNTISIMIFTDLTKKSDDIRFLLVKDFKIIDSIIPSKQTSMNNVYFFEIRLKDEFEFGHFYEIFIPNFGSVSVDVSDAIYFDDFDKKFYYDGNDLGATYKKEETSFAIWAPLACHVSLLVYYKKGLLSYDMTRCEKGVYRITVKGDLENVSYQYVVTNSGVSRRVNDPYGKGLTLNSEKSAVVDLEKIKNEYPNVNSNLNKTINDAFIYELNIRDFTIDENTNIKNKGKYLGLIEENRKTKNGNPAGLDYLKFLNVSHVQLLPILDFGNVLDDNPNKIYNWGYDVTSFFSLEGSYSLKPEVPSQRIKEFKQVVNKLHKNNIGVILDVVYNHIFSYEGSDLEKILPGYYFRKNGHGRIINGSGCGNDVASEKLMVRKMIADSLCYLVSMFDVDGFRFDLLGLLDIKTIEYAKKRVSQIKDNVFFYGEGWAIPTGLKSEDQATILNSFKMPNIGFFNDSFRDILKGSTFDNGAKGYFNGDYSYVDGMYFAMLGSCVDYTFPKRFATPSQSINYAECHDNGTLYDKLLFTNSEEDEISRLDRIKFANSLIAFSFGVPFIHMGQEIGLSKSMQDNTYNMGDAYNKMDYSILDKRFEMAKYLKELINFRNNMSFLKTNDPKIIENIYKYEKLEDGGFKLQINNIDNNNHEGLILVNPSDKTKYIPLDDYYRIIFTKNGFSSKEELYVKNLTQSPFSIVWLVKK